MARTLETMGATGSASRAEGKPGTPKPFTLRRIPPLAQGDVADAGHGFAVTTGAVEDLRKVGI